LKNIKIYIGLFFFFSSTIVAAQRNLNNNKNFQRVVNMVEEKRFYIADNELDKFSEKYKDNFYYNFYKGICQLYLWKNNQAIIYFKSALALAENQDLSVENYLNTKYYLATALFYTEKIDSAMVYFNQLYATLPAKYKIRRQKIVQYISKGMIAKEFMHNPKKIKIKNISALNTIFNDDSPLVSADGKMMVFTSSRVGSTGGRFTQNGDFYEDIYSAIKPDTSWILKGRISDNINTENHESNVWMSIDAKELYVYKNEKGNGNIYISHLQEAGTWSTLKPLDIINTDANESSAFKTFDGKYLFFVSDRKGGYGGKDIYYIKRLKNGTWSKAINAGNTINTRYDEESPYLQLNNLLYFSSEGHKNMGGFDIFISKWNDNKSFGIAENMGYPLNSVADDLFFTPSFDGLRAYFCSKRKSSKGQMDIYKAVFPASYNTNIQLLSGIVQVESGSLDKVKITPLNQQIEISPNYHTGQFFMPLDKKDNYSIKFEAKGNQTVIRNFTLKQNKQNKFYQYFDLDTICLKVPITDVSALPIVINDTLFAIKAPNLDVLSDKVQEEDIWNSNEFDSLNISPVLNFHVNTDSLFKQSKLITNTTRINNIYTKKEKINLPGFEIVQDIPFQFNNYNLKNLNQLKKLKTFLNQNLQSVILLVGHTDSKGDSLYNLKLSQKRITSVYNQLISWGVNPAQIVVKNVGEKNRYIDENQFKGELYEEAAGLNRRVDVRVLKQGKNNLLYVNSLPIPKKILSQLIDTTLNPVKNAKDSFIFRIELIQSAVKINLNSHVGIFKIDEKTNKFGVYSYELGNFKTKEEALYWLREMKNRGFTSARIIVKTPIDDKISYFYSIHLLMTDKPVKNKLFAKLDNVIVTKTKDYYHYYYGQFLSLKDAEKARKKVVEIGFDNAFIFINDYSNVEK